MGILFAVFLRNDVLLHFFEEPCGEDKIVERLVVGLKQGLFVADPFTVTFVKEDDILADAEHGVHVVGVDDSCHVILVRDVVKQFVNED